MPARGGGGGGGGGGFSGATGILRLFNAEFGGGISWLLPFALISFVSGLVLRARAPRTDRARAGYLMWGLWLAVNGLVFSFMSGIIHSYYAVVLAPAIAALVGAGVVELWGLRERYRFGGLALAGAILVSATWSWQLLDRSADFVPGLGLVVLAVGAIVALVLALPATADLRRTQALAVALGLAALLIGPAAYTIDTMSTAYSSGDPRPGPTVASDTNGWLRRRWPAGWLRRPGRQPRRDAAERGRLRRRRLRRRSPAGRLRRRARTTRPWPAT